MVIDPAGAALAVGSGTIVGLVLGLIGGGGSILAVPLLVYAVGVGSPHVAIGTGALAVALNAAVGLAAHARAGRVRWAVALVFAAAGMAGAAAGAALGKAMDGRKLLALFGLAMIVVGVAMLRRRTEHAPTRTQLSRGNAGALLPLLVAVGGGVGALSGFFGIGGGFLIVPGLMAATGMALHEAVGTSLVAVTAFGLTTAASYALAGYVDWTLAALMVAGGVAGGLLGTRASHALGARRRALAYVFSTVVIAVGLYVTVRGIAPLLGGA